MRPPRPVRIAVLVAAVACLGLAMCAHSQGPSSSTPQQAAPASPTAQSQAGTSPMTKPQKVASAPADAPPPPPPTYFPATKAPGAIYLQQR